MEGPASDGAVERVGITEAGISRQVIAFYGLAREDEVLGPVFASAIQDWPPHITDITDFWVGALLGIRRYKGSPLAAHAKHPLTPEMFDRWLSLWAVTADQVFDEAAAATVKARAQLIGESLKAGLFFKLEKAGPRP